MRSAKEQTTILHAQKTDMGKFNKQVQVIPPTKISSHIRTIQKQHTKVQLFFHIANSKVHADRLKSRTTPEAKPLNHPHKQQKPIAHREQKIYKY